MWNILPNNDLKPHKRNSSCRCKPRVIFENGEMIVIHNSYDGREFREELIEKIKEQFNKS